MVILGGAGCFDPLPFPAGPDRGSSSGDPGSDDGVVSTGAAVPPAVEESSGDDGSLPVDSSMSFFVTHHGNSSNGGNYGGLAGADAWCQSLAGAAGVGDRIWRAYLSIAPIEGVSDELVHARDRIGSGPWFNAAGDRIAGDVDELHAAGVDPALMLTDLGFPIPEQEHDVLTGSDPDGFAWAHFPDNADSPSPTCLNWTSNDPSVWTWVGHADAQGPDAWNDGLHGSTCDADGLAQTEGSGRIYCFAAD